jgi:APA family basic amino acid/polyamine antiporter
MVILIAVYTAVNAMYLHVVPFDEMRSFAKDDTQKVPYLTVSRIFSAQVGSYLTLLVAVSVFGSANPNLLSSPRAFYAMGQDGLVPAALTRVSPRWGTPTVAIWTQAIWALLIVLVPWFTPPTWGLRDFDDVTSFVVFAGFLFYGLTVASVYRLRAAKPDLPRTYRCTGYPWTPALFIAVSVAFVGALLSDEAERKNAVVGLVIIATGVVYYLAVLRRPATAA